MFSAMSFVVITTFSNWQDWALRGTRKTAFHAAVQYYCHQLGIIGYEAPLPVVYADPDTKTYKPTTSPNKNDLSPPISDPTPPHTRRRGMAQDKTPVLGFLPPPADHSSHLMRARKTKKRKAAVGAGNVGTSWKKEDWWSFSILITMIRTLLIRLMYLSCFTFPSYCKVC